MKKSDSQRLWLIGNVVFLIIYGLSISTFIVRIPLFAQIPKHTHALLLVFIYGITIYKIALTDMKSIINHSNFNCILFFLTFPVKFLLFPFFLLSLLNTCKFVCEKRKKYENYFFYSFASDIMQYEKVGYITAYVLEITLMLFSFILLLIGVSSIFTTFSYLYLVIFEYKINPIMKMAFVSFREKCDEISLFLPEPSRECYLNVRNFVFKHLDDKVKEKND